MMLQYTAEKPRILPYDTKVIACVSSNATINHKSGAVDESYWYYGALGECMATKDSKYNAGSDEWKDEVTGTVKLEAGHIFVACGKLVSSEKFTPDLYDHNKMVKNFPNTAHGYGGALYGCCHHPMAVISK